MELIRGVRPMTGQDIEQVADLEQVCFSESWSENLIRMGLDSRLDTYFVYADHGTILGYAVLRILTFARARGVRAIDLEVRESNLGARNLYDSYGFRQEAVRKGYYHNPAEDAIIMWNRAI